MHFNAGAGYGGARILGQGIRVSDLFQEVDEEIRRDRAIELWKRYGNYIIGAALALVIGTGAYVAWRDYSHQKAAEQGARFFAAASLATGAERDKAIDAFDEIAKNANAGYAALAQMREAALKAQAGDMEAAASIYRSVADDSGVDKELRDAANLLAMLHSIERIEPAELDRALAPLQASGNPWRFSALELAALAAARTGEAAKARDLYAKIADDVQAPPGLRARAAEMVAVLGS